MSADIEELLRRYLANPKDFISTYDLGVYYSNNEFPRKAIKYFEEALKLSDTHNAEIKFGLAKSYRTIDREKGKILLDEALKLKPELEEKLYLGSKKFY